MTATYDALNRLTSLSDNVNVNDPLGYVQTKPMTLTYAYDLNGNVVEQTATYYALSTTDDGIAAGTSSTQQEWFSYDAMNRVVVSNGELVGSPGSGQIVRGLAGTNYTYDGAGNRITSTTTMGPLRRHEGGRSGTTYSVFEAQEQTYTYTPGGYLAQVGTAIGAVSESSTNVPMPTGPASLVATYTLDAMGRVTEQREYASGGSLAYDKIATYDADGNALSDQITTVRSDGSATYVQNDTFSYRAYDFGDGRYDGAYQGGEMTDDATTLTKYVNGVGTAQPNTDTSYTYTWWTTEQQGQITFTPNTSQGTQYHSTFTYNGLGFLTQSIVNDGSPRTIDYLDNLNGQIIQNFDWAPYQNCPATSYYIFNGVEQGALSNNGSQNVTYSQSIGQQTATPGNGFFTNNATVGTAYAAFGTQLQQINGLGNQTQTQPSYTVMAGDTLQSIAQELWGDSSYWYLLADANGLRRTLQLVAGETLSIPTVVGPSQNNATTNTVYNPQQAMGNVLPTHPPVPSNHHNGCGVFGEILEAIVAVVVAYFAPELIPELSSAFGGGFLGGVAAGAVLGAATDTVEQGIGLATGLQSKFSWAGVAEGAIGGAIGGALGTPLSTGGQSAFSALGIAGQSIPDLLVQGALVGGLTQGIGVATGLQKQFDWGGWAEGTVEGAASGTAIAAIRGDTTAGSFEFGNGSETNSPPPVQQTVGQTIASQIQPLPIAPVTADQLNLVPLNFNLGTTSDTSNVPIPIPRPPQPGDNSAPVLQTTLAPNETDLGSANGVETVVVTGQRYNDPLQWILDLNDFDMRVLNRVENNLVRIGNDVYHNPVRTVENVGRSVLRGLANGARLLVELQIPIVGPALVSAEIGQNVNQVVSAHIAAARNGTLPELIGDDLTTLALTAPVLLIPGGEGAAFEDLAAGMSLREAATGGLLREGEAAMSDEVGAMRYADGRPSDFESELSSAADDASSPKPNRLVTKIVGGTLVIATVGATFTNGFVSQGDYDSPMVLYHYTSADNLQSIETSQSIYPSLPQSEGGRPGDARYGTGVYLTDVPPGQMNSAGLSYLLAGGANPQKYTHYIAINVSGLNLEHPANYVYVYKTSRDFPLLIAGRVVGSGRNPAPLNPSMP